jgi:hypothetical protein
VAIRTTLLPSAEELLLVRIHVHNNANGSCVVDNGVCCVSEEDIVTCVKRSVPIAMLKGKFGSRCLVLKRLWV